MKGSVAEWSAHWTHNLAVLRFESWSDRWICSLSSQVQILHHTCKQPTDCLMPVGVNPVMLYLNYLFQKKENEANKAIMGYNYNKGTLSSVSQVSIFLVRNFFPVQQKSEILILHLYLLQGEQQGTVQFMQCICHLSFYL